jgi:hypothetical protein
MFASAIHKYNLARFFFALINICICIQTINTDKRRKAEGEFFHLANFESDVVPV